MVLRKQLMEYRPFNEQEERDRSLILHCLDTQPDLYTRENRVAHLTASAWIVNHDRTKVIMAYHNIYQSWSWLGGHADGEQDLLSVALREAREESGVQHIQPVTDDIYSIEILTVDGHVKRGEYVSSHLHLNITYLLEADETDPLFVKADENSGVRWFTLDDAIAACTEPWMQKHIYTKLNQKLRTL